MECDDGVLVNGNNSVPKCYQNSDGLLAQEKLNSCHTVFLSNTNLDHLTSEGNGTQKFKRINNFLVFLETLGHNLSNELSGRPLA